MDPQKLSQLDPKLRDAYQRVMGTTLTQPSNSPPMQAPVPAEPVSLPTQPQTIPQANNFDQMHSSISTPAPEPQTQVIAQKKGSIFTPILIGIAILVFIVVYTFFWTRILNFKLPFELPFLPF